MMEAVSHTSDRTAVAGDKKTVYEPHIVRVRHELKRRQLTVVRVESIAAGMVRIVLGGNELAGFTSLGFDDHVKLFFPPVSSDSGVRDPAVPVDPSAFEKRDFTPRHFDAEAGELWIDFFLHEAGPAAAWAGKASVGDSLLVGGPKGSAQISCAGISLHLLIGDETAVPAIGRRLEELPAGARALVVLEGGESSTWPAFQSRASHEILSVRRKAAGAKPGQEIIDRLRAVDVSISGCFAWLALEAQAARAVRRYLREERFIDKQWIKAAAYWRRGEIGVHDRIEDEVRA